MALDDEMVSMANRHLAMLARRARRKRADGEALRKKKSRERGRNRNKLGWAPGEHLKAEALRPHVTECACCGVGNPRSAVGWSADHDHHTGLFRGFLCQPCNLIVGYVERFGLEMSKSVARYLGHTTPTERENTHDAGDLTPLEHSGITLALPWHAGRIERRRRR